MTEKNTTPISVQTLAIAIAMVVLVGFIVLTNHSLSFPLGGHDQEYLTSLLRGEKPLVEDSWILSSLDEMIVRIVPHHTVFFLLDLCRRWMGVLALLGLATWVTRTRSWIQGVWVASLGIGLLPLRLASTALQPQVCFLFLFCWGGCLTFGKPWSKTGTAEQLGGGLLLGLSSLAAPSGFLFLLPILGRAAFNKHFRQSLEQTFWGGLLLGFLVSLGSLYWTIESGRTYAYGIRPETWTLSKLTQIGELAIDSLGILLLGLLVIGLLGWIRQRDPGRIEAMDWMWPALLALGLGEADPLRMSLATPGVLLLALAGLETIGRIFVARKEQVLIPTLIALALSYHLFFSGLKTLRDRQAHAREVAALSRLVMDHVPDQTPVCLFRLNPVLDYLEAILPFRDWKQVDAEVFRTSESGEVAVKRVVFQWITHYPDASEIWVDPKRMGEEPAMGGIGEELKTLILDTLPSETFVGEAGAELTRFPIPRIKPSNRGKITTIPAPSSSGK